MTFLAILRMLLPPFDQIGIAGILFQQVFMLANRNLVVMDADDLVQLAEAVNPVGHQQDDMALHAFPAGHLTCYTDDFISGGGKIDVLDRGFRVAVVKSRYMIKSEVVYYFLFLLVMIIDWIAHQQSDPDPGDLGFLDSVKQFGGVGDLGGEFGKAG